MHLYLVAMPHVGPTMANKEFEFVHFRLDSKIIHVFIGVISL